jgi:hypothetical protein
LYPALNISNRIIYALILHIIVEFRIVADESEPPNVHPIDFGIGAGELVKSPNDFKVKLIERRRAGGNATLNQRLEDERQRLQAAGELGRQAFEG